MWWNEECAEAPRSLLRRADRFCSFRSSFAGPVAASNGSMWALTRPSGPSTCVEINLSEFGAPKSWTEALSHGLPSTRVEETPSKRINLVRVLPQTLISTQPSTTVVRFAVGLASERRESNAVIIASASLIRG